MSTPEEVRRRYEEAGQSHVFDFVDQISDLCDRNDLFDTLADVAVEGLGALLESARQAPDPDASTIQPFGGMVAITSDDPNAVAAWRDEGMRAIRGGEVAALVLAGGQGTRLGFAGPKGKFDIGLPSHRTLFQLMAERIRKLSMLAEYGSGSSSSSSKNDPSCLIPFYIMTSPLNHEETKSYFQQNEYFGLGSNNVYFFQQGMLPCLTFEGKIIMESAGVVAMAPDGNGGIYPSLKSSGALDDMQEHGVKYLHVFSIDNALVKPADPVFIGYCLSVNADCGNKVVWKAHAHEQVGVLASRNQHPCIVEYSEITREMAEKKDESTGRLVYGAANICNHFYTLAFIHETILPRMGNLYHLAHKKIPYYDPVSGQTVTPAANNGFKLESFIFDVFPLSQRMAVLEVERSEEFAPVKNKAGSPSDSPDSARDMLSKLAQKWIMDAGGKLTGDLASTCEISPLTSYAGEGLETIAKDKETVCPFSF